MVELVVLFLTIGALCARTFHVDIDVLLILSGMIIVSIFIWFRTRQSVMFGVLCAVSCILGGVTVLFSEHNVPHEFYGNRAFDARVQSVDRRLTYSNVTVRDEIFDQMVQVSTSRLDLLPGDHITVRGNVQSPEDFVTDTGRLFPYKEYLESKGVAARVSFAQVVLVEKGGVSIGRIATQIRFWIADQFATYVSFPVDGIVSGMLVGYQGGIPDETETLFRDTGVLHTLVLSGYNIMLLAGFMALLLRALPFHVRTVLTVGVIILLVLVSGSGVASVRAGIMGSIALFAGVVRRTYQPLRGLMIAYLIFFFISPLTIFVDPGFHLSFLATLCMILIIPVAEKWFAWIPRTEGINVRELIVLALVVPMFMLPYMLYFSGMMPLATLPANIALAVLIPLIMALGIVLLLVSFLVPIASLVGILLSGVGSVVLWLLTLFDRLPIWQLPAVSWQGVWLIYIALFMVLYRSELSSYLSQLQKSLERQPS